MTAPIERPTTAAPESRVTVLLATYNGERYLDEQIASLDKQEITGLDVLASDDGSTDATLTILSKWKRSWRKGTFLVRAGPRKGFSENFRSLLIAVDKKNDYFAFCDQDDIWDGCKLAAAISGLSQQRADAVPSLYMSRTRLINKDGTATIGYSPLFKRPPSFKNAIVQSIGGGNTIMLNRAGLELVSESAKRTSFVSHDWWAYLIVSGAGGLVSYDPHAYLGYRQHGGNLVGSNLGARFRIERLAQLLRGRFAQWNTTNIEALGRCADLLTEEARATVRSFETMRALSPPKRVLGLLASGIYRQTAADNIMLIVAAIIGKL